MHNPIWVDRVIQSLDWARGELQLCQHAVEHGIATMKPYIGENRLLRANSAALKAIVIETQ